MISREHFSPLTVPSCERCSVDITLSFLCSLAHEWNDLPGSLGWDIHKEYPGMLRSAQQNTSQELEAGGAVQGKHCWHLRGQDSLDPESGIILIKSTWLIDLRMCFPSWPPSVINIMFGLHTSWFISLLVQNPGGKGELHFWGQNKITGSILETLWLISLD